MRAACPNLCSMVILPSLKISIATPFFNLRVRFASSLSTSSVLNANENRVVAWLKRFLDGMQVEFPVLVSSMTKATGDLW